MITKPFIRALSWSIGMVLFTAFVLPFIMLGVTIEPPEGAYWFWHNAVLLWWTFMFAPAISIYYHIEVKDEQCLPLP